MHRRPEWVNTNYRGALVVVTCALLTASCTKHPPRDNQHDVDTVATTSLRLNAPHPDSVTGTLSPSFPAGAVLPVAPEEKQLAGEWTMPARDLAGSRYSPLADINIQNVQNLKVATTFSTGLINGHEGQPLVVGSTMYVVTPFPNLLYAIDLTKPGGALKWTYAPNPDRRSIGIACCDVVNRGAAFADGKMIYNTLDAQTVAVDANTGKEVWRTRVGDINIGETFTDGAGGGA